MKTNGYILVDAASGLVLGFRESLVAAWDFVDRHEPKRVLVFLVKVKVEQVQALQRAEFSRSIANLQSAGLA